MGCPTWTIGLRLRFAWENDAGLEFVNAHTYVFTTSFVFVRQFTLSVLYIGSDEGTEPEASRNLVLRLFHNSGSRPKSPGCRISWPLRAGS